MIRALLDNLTRRVANMLVRAWVDSTDDATRAQLLQVGLRAGEAKGGLEHLLPYGFTMRVLPPAADGRSAETLVLAIEPDHRLALPAMDRRWRPTDLAPGEVALHTDEDRDGDGSQGHCRLHFRRGRLIEVHCTDAHVFAANDVRVQAGNLARLAGDVVEIHAGTRLHFDVNGYGEDWVYQGGAWRVDTWHIGNVVAGADNAIASPEHAPLV